MPQELWNNYTLGSVDYAKDPTNIRENLKKLQNPVLVIMEDHDVCFPVENWYALNCACKNFFSSSVNKFKIPL